MTFHPPILAHDTGDQSVLPLAAEQGAETRALQKHRGLDRSTLIYFPLELADTLMEQGDGFFHVMQPLH